MGGENPPGLGPKYSDITCKLPESLEKDFLLFSETEDHRHFITALCASASLILIRDSG